MKFLYLRPSINLKLRALLNKTPKKPWMNMYMYVWKMSCLYFICRFYLNMSKMFTDRATGSNYTNEAWYKIMLLVGFFHIREAWNAPSCYIVWLCHEHPINIFIINDLFHVGRMDCLLSYINRTFHCKSDKIFNSWNIFSYFGKPVSLSLSSWRLKDINTNTSSH